MADQGITYDEEFVSNSRGLKLFTCRWLPVNQEPKALIFICHGYAMECSITMKSTAVQLVKVGFAVYGIDYEGHGKSDGPQAYVDNFDSVVDDCWNHFTSICEREENRGKMRFLLGESMGGAVALLLHRKKPDYWNGAILSAPMCKIADEMKPHPVLASVFTMICKLIPMWKLIQSRDIIDLAFKEPEVRKQVSLPFLVLHGEDDKVTDQKGSKQLFEVASSRDKTLKLYPGMWHGLLYGEPQHNIDIVFKDIITWLEKRALLGISRM